MKKPKLEVCVGKIHELAELQSDERKKTWSDIATAHYYAQHVLRPNVHSHDKLRRIYYGWVQTRIPKPSSHIPYSWAEAWKRLSEIMDWKDHEDAGAILDGIVFKLTSEPGLREVPTRAGRSGKAGNRRSSRDRSGAFYKADRLG